MGCCFNLSLRSSGIWLLRDDTIVSAIVALNSYWCPFVGRDHGRLIFDHHV
jgi:hypothetical protein